VPKFKIKINDAVLTISSPWLDSWGELELNAATTFEMARSYEIAANRLLAIMSAEHPPLMDPTYFLYGHTVELALKALLLANDLPIPTSREKGHELGEILQECLDEKLIGLEPDFAKLHILIDWLGSGNEGHLYRYPGTAGRIRPDLPWVRDAVGRLMQIVEPHVTAWITDNAPPPPKRFLIFGKPTISQR